MRGLVQPQNSSLVGNEKTHDDIENSNSKHQSMDLENGANGVSLNTQSVMNKLA